MAEQGTKSSFAKGRTWGVCSPAMGFDTRLARRDLLGGMAGGLILPWQSLLGLAAQQEPGATTEQILADMAAYERINGLTFSDAERKAAVGQVKEIQDAVAGMRKSGIPYHVAPCTPFVPVGRQPAAGRTIKAPLPKVTVALPSKPEDIAFLTVTELATLIRSKKLTSRALTEICLARLKKHGPRLECVVTLMEESALADADRADAEIKAGKWRGPLHGIPCVIKDLFATKGTRTTWGAAPFKDQMIDEDAAVVTKLREAGSVICAKSTLGALAMDDKWFGGQTRNPWNPSQGSSGSSAGSASAVSAGLVPFAIGTETLGSIVSPSQRCRVTGLRPTFGRVSRHGAMALSWTMDKVGPITRTAQDALLVLAALVGADPRDGASVDRPLIAPDQKSVKGLKVGMLVEEDESAREWQKLLEDLELEPEEALKITPPSDAALLGLSIEGAAAFDAITRNGVVNQVDRSLWPTIFRGQRYASAVDYIQSLRERAILMARFDEELLDHDVIVVSDSGSHLLLSTNLTGHPQLYIPLGPDSKGTPRGISLIGRLYEEGKLCAYGQAIQEKVQFHRQRPPEFAS